MAPSYLNQELSSAWCNSCTSTLALCLCDGWSNNNCQHSLTATLDIGMSMLAVSGQEPRPKQTRAPNT